MKKSKDKNLLESATAVEDYLDDLLQITAQPRDAGGKSRPVRNNVVLLPELALDQDLLQPPPDADADADAVEVHAVAVDVASVDALPAAAADSELEQQAANAFELPLQCLMFEVAGLQLSLPLVELGSVVPWPENLTRIPGAQEWSQGVLQHLGHNVKVVDTAGLLGINRQQGGKPPAQALILAGFDWALSCDRVGEIIKLEADQIQWRCRDNGGFSVGTIKSSLAQLLHPGKIVQRLEQVG